MTSPLCRSALELGAVSGAFTPAAMADALGLDTAQRQALWRELSGHVAEVLEEGTPGYGWVLTPDARVRQFQALVSRAGIDRLLAQAPPLWPEDRFGIALRRLLSGEAVRVDISGHGEDDAALLAEMRDVGAMLEAAQFARHVAPLDGAALDVLETAAKRRIQELQRRRDLTLILPHRHRGYDAERARLSRFLRGQDGDARPVCLSGIAGAGKSALLARMFGYWQPRSDSPLTVVIDFDRRQLMSGKPVEILGEFLRQCATGIKHKLDDPATVKAVDDGLRALRRDLPVSGVAARERSFESQIGWLDTVTLDALSQDWAAPLRARPIAVLFDSFEAVDRRGGGTVDMIFALEAMLRARLPGLRSVVSGGGAQPSGMEQVFGPTERGVHLAGLAEQDGMALLADEDARLATLTGARHLNGTARRRRLTKALCGHPMALLPGVRFAHSRPEALEPLIRDLEAGEAATVETARMVLYRCIPGRIREPDIRALVEGAVILRTLTPDLIRSLPAGPGRKIGPAEAGALYDALARETWLMIPDEGGFALRPRPELRRLIVPEMAAPARATCMAAAAWYREGPHGDEAARGRWQALSDATRMAHAYYYEALAGTGATPPDLSHGAAQDIRQELGDDLEILPVDWRAPVKARVDMPMDAAERAALSGAARERAEAAILNAERMTGRRRAMTGDVPDSIARMERMIAARFAGADFPRVVQLADRYLALLGDDPSGLAVERFRRAMLGGLFHTPVWELVLSKAAVEGEAAAAALAGALAQINGVYDWRAFLSGRVIEEYDMQVDAFDHAVDRLRLRRSDIIAGRQIPALRPAAYRWRDGMATPAQGSAERAVFDGIAGLRGEAISLADLHRAIGRTGQAIAKSTVDLSGIAPAFAPVMRGANPDLHAPLVTCLRTASSKAVHAVLHDIARETPLWPRELHCDAQRPLDPQRATVVVEIADELGRIDRLAALLGRTDPRALTVSAMHNLITGWFFTALPPEDAGKA